MTLAFLQLFFLRILDMSMFTLRFMMTMRGRRLLTWVFGFAGSLAYVMGVRSVLSDLSDPARLLGYAAGYASGMLVGMAIEERLAVGYTQIKAISPGRGAALCDRLRAAGYAVTETPARGRDGAVDCLMCSVPRKKSAELETLILEIDPQAFVTAQDVRPLQHGYWPQRDRS
ncbi:MAG: DUF2179 domain-containing protein [Chloroflexota bacterium]